MFLKTLENQSDVLGGIKRKQVKPKLLVLLFNHHIKSLCKISIFNFTPCLRII